MTAPPEPPVPNESAPAVASDEHTTPVAPPEPRWGPTPYDPKLARLGCGVLVVLVALVGFAAWFSLSTERPSSLALKREVARLKAENERLAAAPRPPARPAAPPAGDSAETPVLTVLRSEAVQSVLLVTPRPLDVALTGPNETPLGSWRVRQVFGVAVVAGPRIAITVDGRVARLLGEPLALPWPDGYRVRPFAGSAQTAPDAGAWEFELAPSATPGESGWRLTVAPAR